jgi:hypothetical protein
VLYSRCAASCPSCHVLYTHQHANSLLLQQAFYVWKQKPGERITVWQFWQRLQEAGLAFWPGKDRRGALLPPAAPMLHVVG